jgi:sporulation protein YlmC with PRC-barrel domain
VSAGRDEGRPPDFWLGEILDQQLLDRQERPMGMVDGLVLQVRDGRPPKVTHLLVGGDTLARRLGPPIRWLVLWFARRYGVRRGEPYRIPWSAVRDVGVSITIDLDARDTPVLYWEDRVGRLVKRVPGA